MKRFCCFTFFKNKSMDGEQVHLGSLCCEESPPRREDKEDTKCDPECLSTPPSMMSPNLSQCKRLHRPSLGNSQPASASCPQLLIEKSSTPGEFTSDSNQFHNSLRSENRNNLSVRLHGASSQRHSRPRPSNSFLTKTSSFKRIMSFRSSTKRDKETRSFQLNFLGQIYRKKSTHSTNSSNCQEEACSSCVSENELNQVQ